MSNWSFAVTVMSNGWPAVVLPGTVNANVTATPGVRVKLFDVAPARPALAAPIV